MMRFFLLAAAAVLTLPGAPAAARDIAFADRAPGQGAIVIPLADISELDRRASSLSAGERAEIRAGLALHDFDFASQAKVTLSPIGNYRKVVIIGLGDDRPDSFALQEIGGLAAQATESDAPAALMAGGMGSASAVNDLAVGARLGGYNFDKYLRDEEDVDTPLTIIGAGDSAETLYASRGDALADGVYFARDLINEPGNIIYPQSFVERTRTALSGVDGISMRIIERAEMAQLGMGAIQAVGRGSARPPRMMILQYNGGGADRPILLAGKGITFDTGGISLKNPSGMGLMKGDMGGAAAVVGATISLARSRALVNIVTIAALAENMPGANATRPGDIVRAYNGKSIEIISTDAEGRLVLADALSYGERQYQPIVMVDVATLTGSVGRALGDRYGGLFTRNDALADQLLEAGEATGEVLWQLPMDDGYAKLVESPIADVRNSGTGGPGATTGAHFIENFVASTPWAHLDIAGVDNISDTRPTIPAGMVGFSVRLLDHFVRNFQPVGSAE